jgi:hypothetical protein
MIRALVAVTAMACGAAVCAPVQANDVQDVLKLWASQAGSWSGEIDIYTGDNPVPQTVGLKTRWDSVPSRDVVTKIETFVSPGGANSSVTLMFAGPELNSIVTPYFVNGKQHDYHFAVISTAVTDDTHWTTVIATPGGQEVYEGRPAVLRYVRTRDGNRIENTKEVNFLDDNGDSTYRLRSLIRQTKEP